MIEDKLTREERLRLESLNQATAIASAASMRPGQMRTIAGIISDAKEFENYLKGDR